jgi:hypothetical protein
VVARNANGQLELLTRGSNSALYQKRQSGVNGGWSEWAFLDGVVTSYLGLGQNSDGRLEAFARGTDYALYHLWQVAPSGGWSGWFSLGFGRSSPSWSSWGSSSS